MIKIKSSFSFVGSDSGPCTQKVLDTLAHTRMLGCFNGTVERKFQPIRSHKSLEKEGGSDFAFQLETEEHPRRARKEDKGAECDDETAESGDEESESEPRRQPTRAKGDASISKSITPRLSPDGGPVLDVEINSKRLERVLSLPEGGKARITVEHRGSLGSWKRIVAIAVADIEN
jgi:hypothetical protein